MSKRTVTSFRYKVNKVLTVTAKASYGFVIPGGVSKSYDIYVQTTIKPQDWYLPPCHVRFHNPQHLQQ